MRYILEHTLEILKHTVNQFSLASSLPSKSNTESRNFLFILQEIESSNSGGLAQSTPGVVTLQPQLKIILKQAPEREQESSLKKRGFCGGKNKEPFESKVQEHLETHMQSGSTVPRQSDPGGTERLCGSQKQTLTLAVQQLQALPRRERLLPGAIWTEHVDEQQHGKRLE